MNERQKILAKVLLFGAILTGLVGLWIVEVIPTPTLIVGAVAGALGIIGQTTIELVRL